MSDHNVEAGLWRTKGAALDCNVLSSAWTFDNTPWKSPFVLGTSGLRFK